MTAAAEERAQEPIRLPAARLPGCLGDLSIPPAGLWCLGDPSLLENAPDRHVAIVGTRECSAYGDRTASRLAAACVRAGLVVVSGLARGVDAAAHRGAMKAGGRTIAVLGTGVDVPYPVGHRTLHSEVQRAGLVVSEMEVGTKATPGCFPRRNRLIAGLARAVLVIEAPFKSGAINTSNWAMELGRTVAAVPGQIDDPRSAGSNRLLHDGAHVITDVDDLLELFDLSTTERERGREGGGSLASPRGRGGAPLESGDQTLMAMLRGEAQDVSILAFQSGLSGRQVSERLLRLELEGLVERSGDGYRLAGSV